MVSIRKIFLPTIVIAIFYILLFTYLRNITLVNTTLVNSTPILYKIKLFSILIEGLSSTMTQEGLLLMFLTGFLIGLNLTLMFQKIAYIKQAGSLKFIAGGSSFFGVISGGCASCGLPVLSLFGLSGAVIYLPFKGAELPYISLTLLSGSLFFLLRNKTQLQVCEVKKKK